MISLIIGNSSSSSSSSIFMRVLLCKIHCPSFICFCKPSAVAAHLYNPGPLKLENTPPSTTTTAVASSVAAVDDDDAAPAANGDDEDDGQFSGKSTESNEETADGEGGDEEAQIVVALKSCLRRKVVSPESGNNPDGNKKVRWMDNLGKQLVEIKEFESSDRDSDSEMENRTCVCTIL